MIDPRGMTLRDFSDSVILSLDSVWSLERLNDDALWREWAIQFQRIPDLTQRNIPDPYGFSDWREWAERAYPMLENN